MVEVVDIIDLDKFIDQTGDKQDLIDTYNFLIQDSYNHYWAFDEGCCSLGIIDGVDYCHHEYPKK